jgi:hypothetical protein
MVISGSWFGLKPALSLREDAAIVIGIAQIMREHPL